MQIGDKITGAGFISMLLLASGLDGPGWKICLLLVIASLVVMCIGQQIKKVRPAATESGLGNLINYSSINK